MVDLFIWCTQFNVTNSRAACELLLRSTASFGIRFAATNSPPVCISAPNVGLSDHRKAAHANITDMKFRLNGFTLIELLVTVAIVAILASLAAPSFRTLLVKRSVLSATDALVSDMRLARSEALKRSRRTVVCRSTDGANCAGVGSWSDGWIIFVDMDASSTVTAGDDLVKVQQSLPNLASIQGTVLANTRQIFKYEPTGFAKSADQTFIFTPSGSVPAGSIRIVCVSSQGRPSLRAEGATSC